jgi:MFS family permease
MLNNYRWIALSNTTIGVLIVTINMSILLIALPDIFRGIGIDPLAPGNVGLLLWLIMGYLVVTAVLVVSFGRLGDLFGRTGCTTWASPRSRCSRCCSRRRGCRGRPRRCG